MGDAPSIKKKEGRKGFLEMIIEACGDAMYMSTCECWVVLGICVVECCVVLGCFKGELRENHVSFLFVCFVCFAFVLYSHLLFCLFASFVILLTHII